MLVACNTYAAAGVLGPVRPHFDHLTRLGLVWGRFCERPEHPTGRVMAWSECRTGKSCFAARSSASQRKLSIPRFSNGGEDQDFFRRDDGGGARVPMVQRRRGSRSRAARAVDPLVPC